MASKIAQLKRREKDVFKLRASKYTVEDTENDNTFLVDFYGPEGTPYQLGKWKINLYLPDQYPYKSPSVGFINRIYHPNIDLSSGSVCLDVINQTWTPMYELINIFEVFLPQLLMYPNPASPLNQQAAQIYESDIEKFNTKVRQHITKHALNVQLAQIRRKQSEQVQKPKLQNKENHHHNHHDEESIQEGSSISDHNEIMEDEELKMY